MSYFREVTDEEMKKQCDGDSGGAFTHAGHWANQTPSDGIFMNKDVCPPHTEDWILDAMTHEVAHFCGPMPPKSSGSGTLFGR